MGGAALLIYLLIFVGIIYMFVVVPQRKLKRQQMEILEKLSPGDEIITTAGIYGTVTEVEDGETILLEVAEDTEIRIAKAAVARIIVDVPATSTTADDPDIDTDAATQ